VRRVDRDPPRLLLRRRIKYAFTSPPNFRASTIVIAAVSVVFP